MAVPCAALRVKIRDAYSRMVKNKAVYVALGVNRDGMRKVLGLWIADNGGAKFWLSVLTELKNRGLQDILIAVVDGLKGFPDAITAAFPDAAVQTHIVHLVRHSLNFCTRKDRRYRPCAAMTCGSKLAIFAPLLFNGL